MGRNEEIVGPDQRSPFLRVTPNVRIVFGSRLREVQHLRVFLQELT